MKGKIAVTRFSISTTINKNSEDVWETLADFGGTYRWNPAVVESHSTSDANGGLGAERRCDLGKGQWTEERITGWEDKRSVEISIVNSNVPISRAVVTLTMKSLDEEKTQVDLLIDYKLKFGPIGVLMDLVMVRRMYRKTMVELLAGLKHHVETGEEIGTELPVGASA